MKLIYLAGVTDPFGRNHLFFIAACILLIIGLSILIAKTSIKFSTIINIMLITWIFFEIIKLISNISYLLSDGTVVKLLEYEAKEGISILSAYYPRESLPFHLCSIQPFFILIIKLTKNEKLKDALLKFIFPTATLGAIIAILVGSEGADFAYPLTYEYFLFHTLLTVFAISIVIKKQITITLKSHLQTLLMILLMFVGSIWLNSILSDTGTLDLSLYTNFFYSMRPPIDDVHLPILNLDNGWFVYFFTIIGIGVTTITLLQLPFIIKNHKNNK